MASVLLFIVASCVLAPIVSAVEIGKFWQLTDIHYDANYSEFEQSPLLCHRQLGNGSGMGHYGDYNCDSPWPLVVSAINAMKEIEPAPDFILWTGDSVPHVPDETLSPTKVLGLVQNVTTLLTDIFSDIPIFPVLGNHDSWPANQLPPRPNGYYESLLYSCGWEKLLDDDAQETFQKGGYYNMKTPSGHTVLGLNTALYYNRDLETANITDPTLQFIWLEQQLGIARFRGEKVYIVGHVPPGTMARAPIHWFYENFNNKFLGLLQQYNDCILVAIFGHEHTDSFRVVYDTSGVPVIPMFLAPAVTPWKSSIPGIGANNPSIRLYTYDKATGQVLDYVQTFVNLQKANDLKEAVWTKEYQATEAYGLDDVSAKQLDILVHKLRDRESRVMFDNYYAYNSVLYDDSSKCNSSCRVQHLCAIMNISYSDYTKCIKHKARSADSSHFPAAMLNHYGIQDGTWVHQKSRGDNTPAYIYVVIAGVVTLMSVVLLTITILCCRKRNVSAYLAQPQYMPIRT